SVGERQYLLELFAVSLSAQIEDRFAVDFVFEEDSPPAFFVNQEGRIAHGYEIYDTQRIRKYHRSCKHHLGRAGCVVVMNSAEFKVSANEFKEFGRENIAGMVAPMKGGVHYDHVKFVVRITQEPAPAVIDDDLDFGIV